MLPIHQPRRRARLAVPVSIAIVLLLQATLPAVLAAPPQDGRHSPRSPVSGTVSIRADAPIALGERPAFQDPKLDTALAEVAAAADDTSALAVVRRRGLTAPGGRLSTVVVTRPDATDAVRAAIERAGGEPGFAAHGGRWVEALLPPAALRRLTARADVTRIRVPDQAFEAATPAAGTYQTQGDAALDGPAWRSAGYNGSGIRIGVMDVGFMGYASLLGDDLPSSVTVRNFVNGETQGQLDGTTVHGTACAEIVHDIAPSAQLFLAKVGSATDFEEAADWLVDVQHVDIITSSIGFYNATAGDGRGFFHDIIQEKRNAGTIWFTAASNDREAHWGGTFSDADGDRLHQFNGSQEVNYFGPNNGTGNAFNIQPGYRFRVYLRWSDWSAPVDQDFDLYLVRWNGTAWTVVAQSTADQDGSLGQTPTEFASIVTYGSPAPYGWYVRRFDANRLVNFEMFAPKLSTLDEQVRPRSLGNLSDADAAVTVAALDATSPYAFESYSSEGPTNGPGGLATGGINKPDISGYANVDTASYGDADGEQFNGTSSATPHVAGAAALLLDARPLMSPDQVETFLRQNAVDRGVVGTDPVYGAGRLRLNAALPADNTPPTVIPPIARFRSGSPGLAGTRVGTSSTPIPVQVAWIALDSSGIGDTSLFRNLNGGIYSNVSLATNTTTNVVLSFAPHATNTHRFQDRAWDTAGNASGYALGSAFKVREAQDPPSASVVYTGGIWYPSSLSGANGYYGGTVRYATAAGRKATFSFTGTDVALVTTFGPDRGKIQLRLDGTDVGTKDLYRAGALATRQIVYQAHFSSSGPHTLEVTVLGQRNPASTGTRGDIDAFLFMSP